MAACAGWILPETGRTAPVLALGRSAPADRPGAGHALLRPCLPDGRHADDHFSCTLPHKEASGSL